ncbi:hypothetical protein [Flavilitoribacter nigricans]|uniref:TIGR02588 family protein n=1 Tax=Flavilitoribacter nigricans (strain ATCC 23147 / DSM 23189 / NBRC 102662 / NCIMB 1420 / SS-2) TaxID=1122177 RepID=A0A2D0N105_FLAN2|nr:hypothetical protein [Flavilitoribacter nigricans]PHN02194.1 hypothetical protein CRP01_33200 [Flavilitoribacter nigricans DSM 23189 = NBRC 102662]
MSKAQSAKQKKAPPPTIVEWSVRGFSLLIIFSLIGYFLYGAFQAERKPEFLVEVKQDEIRQIGNRWVIPVDVSNKGTYDVHQLKIQARLKLPNGPEAYEAETSEVLLLGCDEKVSLEFSFAHDPLSHPFECQAVSYLLP